MFDVIKINGKSIGGNQPCFLIAEVAQAHDGSLGQAHAFIDAAAEAGADAVKFQTHLAFAESTLNEQFRIPMQTQDASRYEYWKRMEFSKKHWQSLALHAKELGLIFLSSAFSIEAVELLDSIGMPAWKIGSGEFRSDRLLDRILKTGKPILISTGMSQWDEIDAAYKKITRQGVPVTLFQCTSQYPTPLTSVGLNIINQLRKKYHCPIGLSDHSASIWPGIIAMARGLDILEVHVTFDRNMFGPDSSSSLIFSEFQQLCQARDSMEKMDSSPVDKDKMAVKLSGMRQLFTKSLALKSPQKIGTLITENMLCEKKPGTGIPNTQLHHILGRVLAQNVASNRLLSWEDFK